MSVNGIMAVDLILQDGSSKRMWGVYNLFGTLVSILAGKKTEAHFLLYQCVCRPPEGGHKILVCVL